MLYSYDLGHYNVSEPSNAQRLVYHIVSRDRVTAVSDALEVVKAYSHLTEDSVYLFRLRYLIDHHRHAESMELLHSLPQHQQVTCGKQLVIGTRLLLRNDGIVFNQQNTNALSLLHTRSSCDILQHLLTLDLSADDQEHFEELLSNLKNIHVLQVEFGEFVSYEDYCSDDMRQEMCKERLLERHASMRDFGERKPGLAAPSDCRVYRQAQVLRINRDVLYGQRTLDAIKMGNIDEAIHWCRSDLNTAMELACLIAGGRRSTVSALPQKRPDDRTARDGTAV
ncbi:hypothetical protein LSAT2_025558 [Lamellibrachia satsuma]|nr:hypothetical protein LSAT2_025558 [Lamellibrachia satsuma]